MQSNWSRRGFVKLLGVATGATALGLTAFSCTDSRSASDAPSGPLTDKELDRIVAIAFDLFDPGDARTRTDLEASIRWWARGRTTAGPHLQLYRDVLADSSSPSAAKALRAELIEGIYSTGPGWKSLGYTTWPGVPSGPLAYTTRPQG